MTSLGVGREECWCGLDVALLWCGGTGGGEECWCGLDVALLWCGGTGGGVVWSTFSCVVGLGGPESQLSLSQLLLE
ncbi:hypothetical protein [Pasteuria penetrans]|uniref:hypothetical protein n=1 Tax=Pasteuria penetrans TaxID=86005 RepID=UPI0011EF13BB|nr:hypothetical protein [Pasteuria penetrans]